MHPSFLGSEVREGLCDGTDGAHGVKALSPMQGHGTESASVTGDRESGHSLGRPPLQPRDWCQPCPSQLPPGTQGGGGMAEAGGKIEARKPVQISPSLQVSLFPEAELRGFNPKPRGGQHVCLCTKQLTRGDSRAPSEPTSWGQNCTLKSRAGLEPPTFPAALGAGGQRQSQILLPGSRPENQRRTQDGPRMVAHLHRPPEGLRHEHLPPPAGTRCLREAVHCSWRGEQAPHFTDEETGGPPHTHTPHTCPQSLFFF